MRIGIDAKSMYTGPVSTRIVLQNLLPELFRLYPEIEWVVFLDKKDEALGFPFSDKAQGSASPDSNIRVEYVWAGVNQLSNLFVLPRYCRKLKLDLVVYQTFPAITRGTASIAFIHDVLFRDFPEFFTWKERLYFTTLPFLTRRAIRVTATTAFVAKDLVRYGYVKDPSGIDLVPLGVSSAFKPREDWDPIMLESLRSRLSLPDRFLLFVGRLNVRKNLENLLNALSLIADQDIPLVIVGKADWKTPNLETHLSDPSIARRVIMTGSVDDEELPAVYALSTIFCFPSFAEGFGLPPLEAMASGVPVIVANRTSLPEVCGDAATYAAPEDPASIAASIDQLLSDKSLYAAKKESGVKRAAQFTWTNTAVAIRKSINNAFNI
jgi:glycosyltransferase involved in cell wall biosynthesis